MSEKSATNDPKDKTTVGVTLARLKEKLAGIKTTRATLTDHLPGDTTVADVDAKIVELSEDIEYLETVQDEESRISMEDRAADCQSTLRLNARGIKRLETEIQVLKDQVADRQEENERCRRRLQLLGAPTE